MCIKMRDDGVSYLNSRAGNSYQRYWLILRLDNDTKVARYGVHIESK